MPLHKRILDNGTLLVTEPVAAASVTAIGFWFPVGSRHETAGKSGITHFLEHLLFKGTPRYSVNDISLFFDRTGGYINAFTERDTVCLYCVVPAQFSVAALQIVLDMTTAANLDEQDIEKERQVILSEILSALDDPEELSSDLAMTEWFPNNLLSSPVAGTYDDVLKLQRADIQDWYQRHFRSGPLMVCISGVFSEDEVIPVLSADTARRPNFARVEMPALQLRPGRTVYKAPINQTHIYLSAPAISATESQFWFPWAVLNTIIGETPSSRLFHQLREERGLCYTVYSMVSVYSGCAFWTAFASCPAEAAAEAVDVLLAQTALLKQNGCSVAEVDLAVSHLCGELIVSSQDAEHRMKRLARQVLAGGELFETSVLHAQYQAVSPALVNSLCAQSLDERALSLVLYGHALKGKERKKICLKPKKIP